MGRQSQARKPASDAARPAEARRVDQGRSGRRRRSGWGVADQALSSLISLVVSLAAARACGAEGFGIFATAWVTSGVALAVSHGLASDPLTVRFAAAASPVLWRRATAAALATSLAVGVAFGALCALVGVLVGGSLGRTLLVLGVVLPGVLFQDAWRFAFFAAGLGRRAFVADLLWVVSLPPLLVLSANAATPEAFVLAWGLGALVSGTATMAISGFGPRPTAVGAWLREHGALNLRFSVENTGQAVTVQLVGYGTAAIAGFAALGGLRAAAQLFGPLKSLLSGLALLAVAEGVRTLHAGRGLRRYCVNYGLTKIALVLAWSAVALLLPDRLGRLLLGSLWDGAEPLLLPTALALLVGQPLGAARVGLRALGAAKRSLRIQLVTSGWTIALGLSGAAIAGARGVAWAGVLAVSVAAALWWRGFEVALRQHRRETDAALANGAPAQGPTAAEGRSLAAASVHAVQQG